MKQCHVEKEDIYRGQTGFQGNVCKILLNNVDKLRQICEKRGDVVCLKYVDTFSKFNEVVDSCFSTELKDGFARKIDAFEESYLALKNSVTPKIHVIYKHVR